MLQLTHQVYAAARGYAQCNAGLESMLFVQHRPALSQIRGLQIP